MQSHAADKGVFIRSMATRGQLARIRLIEVDCSVGNSIVKRGNIAQQLDRAGRSHRMADEAFCVVDRDVWVIFEHICQRR